MALDSIGKLTTKRWIKGEEENMQKRNGNVEVFSEHKLRRSIIMALESVGEYGGISEVDSMVSDVSDDDCSTSVIIGDRVERVLTEYGYLNAAHAYMKYRIVNEQLPAPDAISDYIHVAKYARFVPALGRREMYHETVDRVCQMHVDKFPHLEHDIRWAFNFVHSKEVLPSMRSMQFGGPAINAHNARMYNCSFTHIDSTSKFGEIFYLLLCGCGVGYSVQWQHVNKLQRVGRIGKKVYHHAIGDSIQGWSEAVHALMEAYFYTGEYIEFCYSNIRDEGSPLITSGGKAPGHLALKKMLEIIRSILDNAQGRKLRPIECHDICCHIADAVLAGGIRRSSLISLFSPDDTEMLYCKASGNFVPFGLNSQRMMANNSMVLLRTEVNKNVFDRLMRVQQEGYGEPGFYFTNNADWGCNPCGEIGMNPVMMKQDGTPYPISQFSFCNLTEINLTRVDDMNDACRAASIIGTLQASYTDVGVPNDVLKRDALLGVSITGYMDAGMPDLSGYANVVNKVNQVWANKLLINPAARTTTVKPSGTASLALGGVSSGIHPQHSNRYFRRVTANKNEPYFKYFMSKNPHMVEQKPNGDYCIVFPLENDGVIGYDGIHEADGLHYIYDTAFVDVVKKVYNEWVVPGSYNGLLTHAVSCTCTVVDIDKVIEYVWDNRDYITAMAFAPAFLDKSFPFAPLESVTTEGDKRRWNDLIKNYTPIDWSQFVEQEDTTRLRDVGACDGPKCSV